LTSDWLLAEEPLPWPLAKAGTDAMLKLSTVTTPMVASEAFFASRSFGRGISS
jgi:hypothetical protein